MWKSWSPTIISLIILAGLIGSLAKVVKDRKEITFLRYVVEMTTLYEKGNIIGAARYFDYFYTLEAAENPNWERSDYLISTVSKGYALHFFTEAKSAFETENFSKADNDFYVAEFYARDADIEKDFPSWVSELKENLRPYSQRLQDEEENRK